MGWSRVILIPGFKENDILIISSSTIALGSQSNPMVERARRLGQKSIFERPRGSLVRAPRKPHLFVLFVVVVFCCCWLFCLFVVVFFKVKDRFSFRFEQQRKLFLFQIMANNVSAFLHMFLCKIKILANHNFHSFIDTQMTPKWKTFKGRLEYLTTSSLFSQQLHLSGKSLNKKKKKLCKVSVNLRLSSPS